MMALTRGAGSLGVLVALLTGGGALAGPLAPPPGPPASTSKTLQQVEPSTPIESLPAGPSSQFRITASGHYHLTRSYFGGAVPIIAVNAPGVTIDLRGYSLSGGATLDHVIESASFYVTVRNGVVLATTDAAIELTGANAVVEDVQFGGADAFGGVALRVGEGARVRDCSFRSGGSLESGPNAIVNRCVFGAQRESLELGDGSVAADITISGLSSFGTNRLISLGDGCTLLRVHATDAFNAGVLGGDGCSIIDSSFTNPSGVPSTGTNTVIRLGDSAVVRGVRIASWGDVGIEIDSGVIEGCALRRVIGTAIVASRSYISGCSIENCTIGFSGGTSTIIGCAFVQCTTNTVATVNAGIETLVADCLIASNVGDALSLTFNSEARGNRLRSNGGGIVVASDARVINNTIDSDPIIVTGNDNVIDGNVITDPPLATGAIDVQASGNLIIRNQVTGGVGAYVIVAGNSVGTISANPAAAGPYDNLVY